MFPNGTIPLKKGTIVVPPKETDLAYPSSPVVSGSVRLPSASAYPTQSNISPQSPGLVAPPLQALTGKTTMPMPNPWSGGANFGGCNDGIGSWHSGYDTIIGA
jgi:hypothetical protein